MNRLTQKDEQGDWCLRGLAWERLHVGQVITQKVWERLYGALWKLMEYEDTGLSPEQVEDLQEEQRKHQWNPVAERLPKPNERVLMYRPCMAGADTGPVSVQWGWAYKDASHWMVMSYPPEMLPEAGAEAGACGLAPAT